MTKLSFRVNSNSRKNFTDAFGLVSMLFSKTHGNRSWPGQTTLSFVLFKANGLKEKKKNVLVKKKKKNNCRFSTFK